LAACGGSYDKADFVARANAICARALRDTRAVPPPTGGLAGLGDYAAHVLKVVRGEESDLHGLAIPTQSAANRALLKRYLTANADVATAYAQLAAAAKRGDASGVGAAEAALRASPVSALAARYGLHDCSSPGATVG
jgi:hypothetical protein